ncbi:ArsR/SmtB family transcription factor [Halosimplex salinum]|uniref:ArsR/SmtB family transcription factor n=1 Tax=Halosimplex salinum TaxID=1710538 RepID=UPI000F466ED5|nr:helix-turn-helix domain-containing protein [Halosimplex salinum]
MTKISRIRHGTTDDRDATPRFVELGSEEEDRVFDALSSETARRIYRALHEEPRTPSALAAATEKSVQTVSYHLTKLESAALVESVGTRYSEKGKEMTVWAPAQGAVVIAEESERARRSLEEYLGATVGVVAASAVVRYASDRFVAATPSGSPVLEPAGTGGAHGAFDGVAQLVAAVVATVQPGLVLLVFGLALIAAEYARDAAA